MIGQHQLLALADSLIKKNAFPRFLILLGDKDSGRYTLTHELRRKLGAYLVECNLGIDDVRQAIENSYKCGGTSVYLFRDADKMSLQAKNSLLKITEEPPKSVHFILTVQNLNNLLPTLISRATIWSVEPYATNEVEKVFTKTVNNKIIQYADTPGMAKRLNEMDEKFIPFCEDVIDYVSSVTLVNSFKIISRISIKDGDNKYDSELFLKVLKNILRVRLSQNNDSQTSDRYAKMLRICEKYRYDLTLSSLKKEATLTSWLLEMRKL